MVSVQPGDRYVVRYVRGGTWGDTERYVDRARLQQVPLPIAGGETWCRWLGAILNAMWCLLARPRVALHQLVWGLPSTDEHGALH